ncbi:hypothetical protein INR75_15460 [Zunongwangia sp. SCSIO 43204]|uniref:hypothetical protein n=1 Tax=Zunongwangia sp. SCSIO 43204 TaxID=2779359 RepID=UPI001CA7E9AE|nr:hypothetical protein [Zunongwangia sp. SCSIO 43204]UAB83557.1 hypothetical protein INR75_15460 [Zunongwangia sp. SCSIO 43204]
MNGTFRYVDGNQGEDKVLTSDANGNASWKDAATQEWVQDYIDGYFVYAEVYKSGNATKLLNAGNGNNATAVWKDVDFGTEVVLSTNVATSSTSITVPVKGIYRISYSVMMDNTSGGGGKDIYLKLQNNGNDVPGSLSIANVKNGDIKTVSKTKLLSLNANNKLSIIAGGPESDDSIIIMPDGTNFNIELVR